MYILLTNSNVHVLLHASSTTSAFDFARMRSREGVHLAAGVPNSAQPAVSMLICAARWRWGAVTWQRGAGVLSSVAFMTSSALRPVESCPSACGANRLIKRGRPAMRSGNQLRVDRSSGKR
ncbi:hypothetical protein MHYP_G00315760 [Metynnis hypsauchen]